MYVTDECNLRCTQCYYNPWLKPWNPAVEMPFDVADSLLDVFRELGAIKVSFLGGEPTLYGTHRNSNIAITSLFEAARSKGFEYIRIVTNGLFNAALLDHKNFRLLDEITFSIDGHEPHIHDELRGKGTFERTLTNLRLALKTNVRVHVTTCVHRLNSGRNEQGQLLLDQAIRWAEDLGVTLINFHPLFKMGIPRDSWTHETDISPSLWQTIYREIRTHIEAGVYKIPVRLPERFIPAEIFSDDPNYYGYCPVKLAERLEIHVNGQLHSCALHNGTPVSLARFHVNDGLLSIKWSGHQNEIDEYDFDFSRDHPCAVMQRDFRESVPLCISFKPKQVEPVWQSLGIDEHWTH